MEKRGQAAVFLIIGIILLIVVISVIVIKQDFLKNLFSSISTERLTVPQQVKPVQTFLDSCVQEITKEGINIIAFQGGRLNLEEDNIPTTPFTPLQTSLEIIPDSEIKTSVWFRSRGNGIQELNIPTEQEIENSISQYVEENFANCVQNLTEFDRQGYSTSADGIPEVTTDISSNNVLTTVDFPVNIQILSTNFTLSKHQGSVDSNLGKLYTMAKEIMEKENEDFFLENKTIDTLVAYDPEIPFSGTDFSCTQDIWVKSDVERKLKNVLFENVAAMRIKGTNYDLTNDNQKYLVFDALDTTDSEVTANLMYIPSWPTSIEISPSEGNILKSDLITNKAGGAVSALLSTFFCLNNHQFVYDLKYPVLISLTSSDGLTFQFATQVILDNNKPRSNTVISTTLPDIESPICNYRQKDVTIFTGFIDENNQLAPLEDVTLSYKCFPATCQLGNTILNSDGEPTLTTKVPLCVNGIIEGRKEGYKQILKTYYSSNNENSPEIALVQLEKVYNKKINLFITEKETGETREPFGTETITFQFIHQGTNYQNSYIYPNGNNTLDLIPGKYIVSAYLMRNSSTYKIQIPKEELTTCVETESLGLFALFQKNQVCKTTETEAFESNSVLTGGFTDLEYEFTRKDLSSNEALNLFILSSKIPGSFSDLQKIQIEIETNKDHSLFKEPIVG